MKVERIMTTEQRLQKAYAPASTILSDIEHGHSASQIEDQIRNLVDLLGKDDEDPTV